MIERATFHRYVVSCEGCGRKSRSLADGFGSEVQAVEHVLATGWELVGEDYYCERCAMCDCQECCDARSHYADFEEACEVAKKMWTVNRVSRHVVRCPTCMRYTLR